MGQDGGVSACGNERSGQLDDVPSQAHRPGLIWLKVPISRLWVHFPGSKFD